MEMHVGQVDRVVQVPMEDFIEEEKLYFRREKRSVDEKSYLTVSERESLLMGG